MQRVNPHPQNESPEIAATIERAKESTDQNNSSDESQINQGPKHVASYIPKVIELITKDISGGVYE